LRTSPVLHSFPTRRSSDLEFRIQSQHTEADRPKVRNSLQLSHLANAFDGQAQIFADDRIITLRSGNVPEAAGDPVQYRYQKTMIDRKSTRLNSSHVKISYA